MAETLFSSNEQCDNEARYIAWLIENPHGYVVNCLKTAKGANTKSDVRFTRLHRVKCKTINPITSGAATSAFTTGRYQKLCSNDLHSLDSEAAALTGLKEIRRCPCVARG